MQRPCSYLMVLTDCLTLCVPRVTLDTNWTNGFCVCICTIVYVNSGCNTWWWKNTKIQVTLCLSLTRRKHSTKLLINVSWIALFFRLSSFCSLFFSVLLSSYPNEFLVHSSIDSTGSWLLLTTQVASFCDSRDTLLFSYSFFSGLSLSISLSFSLSAPLLLCLLVNWHWEVHFFHSHRMTGWVIQLASHTFTRSKAIERESWEGKRKRRRRRRRERERRRRRRWWWRREGWGLWPLTCPPFCLCL